LINSKKVWKADWSTYDKFHEDKIANNVNKKHNLQAINSKSKTKSKPKSLIVNEGFKSSNNNNYYQILSDFDELEQEPVAHCSTDPRFTRLPVSKSKKKTKLLRKKRTSPDYRPQRRDALMISTKC
jgi:hypothetical protein